MGNSQPSARCTRLSAKATSSDDEPQITKSIFPKVSMHFLAAALSCSGLRTSACAKIHLWPVVSASSLAAGFPPSIPFTIIHINCTPPAPHHYPPFTPHYHDRPPSPYQP